MALLMVAAAVWTTGWMAIILLSPPSPFPSLPPRELALVMGFRVNSDVPDAAGLDTSMCSDASFDANARA
ncbi:hypothetical protein GGG16DRAFT_119904 [Schizophyllum commune]